ncbi:MAG: 3-oxoacyl-[acyl-carrier-protein] reductase [bacterium]|nr:3-oxoacyl-[acyl-carrier-protein] reductase [bacterium]
MLLEERTAFVTGGARGIGREIALCFAREGADVAVCDRDAAEIAAVGGEIEALGRRAVAVAADVTSAAEIGAAVNKIVDAFGRIDILVNNAGITRDAFLVRMSDADWDAVLAVNLKGAFITSRAVMKGMVKRRSGKIINIASIVGLWGNAGQANYAASKAGLVGLTKSIAKEMASRGITANAVAPGFIETRMTAALPEAVREKMRAAVPMGRFGAPGDVAKAALFLASGLSDYVTGQVIVVDGGMIM